MLYLGVAHARVPGSLNHAERERIFESVRRIERWPGKYDAIADKNPTVVSTPEKPKHEGIKWGFECDRQLSAHEMMYYVRHDHFKLELDIELLLEAFHQDVEKMTEHHSQVREWYRLYLAELYHLITRSLIFTYRGNRPGNFLDFQVVQFMFSVPTTWGTKPIGCFEEAIRHSQFGSVPKHFYQVGPGFTEADAAAVYTMHTLGYTDTMHTAGCTDGAMIQVVIAQFLNTHS